MRHVVDGELAAVAAFNQSLRQHARGGAMCHRQPVADEQDHVACAPWRRAEHFPLHRLRLVAGRRRHRVGAGRLERDFADPIGRLVLSFLVGHHRRGLTEHLRRVAAVDRDLDVRCRHGAGEFNLEIEPGARQDLGTVERIDRWAADGWLAKSAASPAKPAQLRVILGMLDPRPSHCRARPYGAKNDRLMTSGAYAVATRRDSTEKCPSPRLAFTRIVSRGPALHTHGGTQQCGRRSRPG